MSDMPNVRVSSKSFIARSILNVDAIPVDEDQIDGELCSECALGPGYYLLTGRWRVGRLPINARLIMNLHNGEQENFTLPVTKKGNLLQVVQLTQHCVSVWVEFSGGLEFDRTEHSDLLIEPIGELRRSYLLYRRIIPYMWKKWRAGRADLPGFLSSLLWDQHCTYHDASASRQYCLSLPYSSWRKRHAELDSSDRRAIRAHIRSHPKRVRCVIYVICEALSSGNSIRITLDSIAKQFVLPDSVRVVHPDGGTALPTNEWPFELLVFERLEEIDSVAESPSGYASFIGGGSVLHEAYTYSMEYAFLKSPHVELVYSDYDHVSKDSDYFDPVFNPDWSVAFLRSKNYVREGFSLDASRAVMLIKSAPAYRTSDNLFHWMLLRCSELYSRGQVVHLASVLWHKGDLNLASVEDISLPDPVSHHLELLGVAANVTYDSMGRYTISYALESQPLVSIIIPTRDGWRYLRRCIPSVLASNYKNIELLIIDNRSSDQATIDYLLELSRDARVTVIRFDEPFNYSRINNFAVSRCSGEIVCLLNDDTEVITPTWLCEMVGELAQKGVGIVGAKLLYPDSTVQHGGDAVGPGGCADHFHSGLDENFPGYDDRAIVVQDLSAVTGACLVTWRSLYVELGGLNAKQLPVAFNDVDYCLRAGEAGWRVVWTPNAKLYHLESVSRGQDKSLARQRQARKELRYMRHRWRKVLKNDPFYNLNLNYDRPDFSLRWDPPLSKPWLNR